MTEPTSSPVRPRIVFGVTAGITARTFLRGQLAHFVTQGWDVGLLCGEGGLDDLARAEGVSNVTTVHMRRQPSLSDLFLVPRLWRALRRSRPDLVVMGTPKMGVFGTLAALVARVPTRVYVLHGLRAEGETGTKGMLLRGLDRLACSAATDVVAVSASLRDRLVASRVVAAHRVVVLGSGSANGVDTQRFDVVDAESRLAARDSFGIPAHAEVIAFVGRLTRDKGLGELVRTWQSLAARRPSAWLLVAGEDESADEDDRLALAHLREAPRAVLAGHVADVERVYRAADLLLVLSHREGLGMVALEAAACGTPTVSARATGVVDAVIDGQTGILVERHDDAGLQRTVERLLDDGDLRHELGRRGRTRVVNEFEQHDVWRRWERFLRARSHGVSMASLTQEARA